MFSKLKDKLRSAISIFSKKKEDEIIEEAYAKETPEEISLEEVKEKAEEIKEEIQEEIREEKKEESKEKRETVKEGQKEELRKRLGKETKERLKEEVKEEIHEKIEGKIPEKKKEPFQEKEIFEEKKEPVRESHEYVHKPSEKKVEIKPEIIFPKTEAIEEIKKEEPEEESADKGFFARLKEKLTATKISAKEFEELFGELESILLENNVSLEVVEKIKFGLKRDLVDKLLQGKVDDIVQESLKKTVEEVLNTEQIDLMHKVRQKKPFIIAFFGINGAGKTTTLAKVAHKLKKQGLSTVLAASDTFRAAAIQQLEEQGERVGARVIKHDYGSDAAAVAFDAVRYAEKNDIDVVLVDTAGRLHSNTNLLAELKKIVKVIKPDFKIFIGESITGNDCLEQIKEFNEQIGIDGVILTKADVDEKGGTALSVAYTTKKPILYLGIGQGLDDLEEFNKEKMVKRLGL